MDLPDGYTVRPPRMDDAEEIVRLLNEDAISWTGAPMATVDWVTAPWGVDVADLDNDFAVVQAGGGSIAGYLAVQSEPPHTLVFGYGAVAVAHHGRGIGRAVAVEVEHRAQRRAARCGADDGVTLRVGSLADEPRVTELLTRLGYEEVRRFWLMEIRFGEEAPPLAAVAGVDIRPFRPGDAPAVYRCLAEAFEDHWGGPFESEDRWLQRHVRGRDFDPELWQLAWDGDRLAGALVGEPQAAQDERSGYIALLGVRPADRGRGIGEALLRSSFAALHRRGRRGAILLVDSESVTGATRLYERVGMTARPQFATWEKPLP